MASSITIDCLVAVRFWLTAPEVDWRKPLSQSCRNYHQPLSIESPASMQAEPQSTRAQAKSIIALLLTFTAAMVDIVAYITIYHSFVAHMTGTTVHLGNRLATGNWTEAAKAGTTVGSFVAGSVLGRTIIEIGARGRDRRVATVTLLIEAGLILGAIWLQPVLLGQGESSLMDVCILLVLLAGAMGLQTATLTRIGPLTIHTTFVTGMLNKLAQTLSQWFFWIHDSRKQKIGFAGILGQSGQNKAFRQSRYMLAIWFTYMLGSVAGTWMNSRWSVRTLYLAVLVLVASAVTDQVQPLSLEEETDQV